VDNTKFPLTTRSYASRILVLTRTAKRAAIIIPSN